MSLYRQCSEAAVKLMANPPTEFGGVFSEIDVVNLAATRSWKKSDWPEAMRHANQVLGTAYRGRKLARYGPLVLPDGNRDYGRIAAKIVYAAAETGPEVWDTPNGRFPRLMIEDDDIGRQGRRFGTNRNDLVPWETQNLHEAQPAGDKERIKELEAETERLRSHAANGNGHDEDRILALYTELEERVSKIEEIEAARKAVYTS